MSKSTVIILFDKKSIFNRILTAIFFTLAIFFIYKHATASTSFFELTHKQQRSLIYSILLPLIFGVKFGLSIAHHFNFKEMQYRTYYFIGPVGYGTWKKFKKLDRVSTFLNSNQECEVNIWDIRNNRYKIAVFDEIDNAVSYGRDLAKTLNLKFKERN